VSLKNGLDLAVILMIRFTLLSLILSFSSSLMAEMAENFYPAPLMHMDNAFSHHVIVAEKNTHTLYLFKNVNSRPVLVKSYQMASGKKAGDKVFQGDHRTPEGVFFFTDFINHQQLIERHGKQGEIYGVGAFVMDYPNPIDKAAGKTGSGIWLHSTNDETRIDKGLDSRGCLVTHNSMLIELSEYIELNRTPIIVTHDLKYLSQRTWNKNKTKIMSAVKGWVNSWQNEDLKSYLSFYHKKEFQDKSRGNYYQFADYKKAVFLNPGKPVVNIKELSVMQSGDYAIAVFKQEYESATIKDIGRKILYLKKDQYYKWKIVSENWTKNGVGPTDRSENVAFRPEMRFFKTRNPSQIMGESWTQSSNN
jgi:murein L,D-transpeptidase YafK